MLFRKYARFNIFWFEWTRHLSFSFVEHTKCAICLFFTLLLNTKNQLIRPVKLFVWSKYIQILKIIVFLFTLSFNSFVYCRIWNLQVKISKIPAPFVRSCLTLQMSEVFFLNLNFVVQFAEARKKSLNIWIRVPTLLVSPKTCYLICILLLPIYAHYYSLQRE